MHIPRLDCILKNTSISGLKSGIENSFTTWV